MYVLQRANKRPYLQAQSCFSTLPDMGILSEPLRISIDAVQDLSRLPFRGSDWPQFLQPTYFRRTVSSQSIQYSDEPSSFTLQKEAAHVPKISR